MRKPRLSVFRRSGITGLLLVCPALAIGACKDVSGPPVVPTGPDVTSPSVMASSPVNRAADVSATTAVRVTFSEPINPATLTDSTFTIKSFLPTGSVVIQGIRSYDAATNTAIFTATLPYRNYVSYAVTITTGVRDMAGNRVASQYTSCFTPTAGSGVARTLNGGHWAGNDACVEVHWHIPIDQTGTVLSRNASCGLDNVDCRLTAVSEAGRAVLGGSTCRPGNRPAPSLCDVLVVSLTGTVNGTSISFNFTTDNGLTFKFVGAFASSRTISPYLTGTISGTSLTAVGINFSQEH